MHCLFNYSTFSLVVEGGRTCFEINLLFTPTSLPPVVVEHTSFCTSSYYYFTLLCFLLYDDYFSLLVTHLAQLLKSLCYFFPGVLKTTTKHKNKNTDTWHLTVLTDSMCMTLCMFFCGGNGGDVPYFSPSKY